MQITANHIHLFISYAVAFLVFGLIGKWYVWPSIKDRDPKSALSGVIYGSQHARAAKHNCYRPHETTFRSRVLNARIPRGSVLPRDLWFIWPVPAQPQ